MGSCLVCSRDLYLEKSPAWMLDFLCTDHSSFLCCPQSLEKVMNRRNKAYAEFKRLIALRIKYFFIVMLSHRQYIGRMTFNHNNQSLEMWVRGNYHTAVICTCCLSLFVVCTLISNLNLCKACESWVDWVSMFLSFQMWHLGHRCQRCTLTKTPCVLFCACYAWWGSA